MLSQATISSTPTAWEDQALTAEVIEDWLVFKLSERLGIEPSEIDVQEPFDNYGLASTDAVIISGDLEMWLNRELSATLLWDYPTIRVLGQYLAQA
jgi:acyl carrier protein